MHEMRKRETVITALKREQAQDRVRIQRLLSISQPVTRDKSYVYEGGNPEPTELVHTAGADWRNPEKLVFTSPKLPPPSLCTRGYAEYLARKAQVIDTCRFGLEELESDLADRLAEAQADRGSQVLWSEEQQGNLVEILERRRLELNDRIQVAMEEYLRLRHNARIAYRSATARNEQRLRNRRIREAEAKVSESAHACAHTSQTPHPVLV